MSLVRNRYLAGAAAAVAGALLLSPIAPASAIVKGARTTGSTRSSASCCSTCRPRWTRASTIPAPGSTAPARSSTPTRSSPLATAPTRSGMEGEVPDNPLYGGTDVWFTVEEEPDYSILPPSTTFAPEGNDERYDAWSAILDASDEWSEAESTFTHPEFDPSAFFVHDLGVVEPSEPIELDEYGTLPEASYLDTYYSKAAKQRGLFESVGTAWRAAARSSSLAGTRAARSTASSSASREPIGSRTSRSSSRTARARRASATPVARRSTSPRKTSLTRT